MMRENTPVFEEYLFHIISTLIIYPIFIFGILLYIILYFQAWRVGHLLDELALEPLEELFHLPHPQFELHVLPLQCLGHLLLVGLKNGKIVESYKSGLDIYIYVRILNTDASQVTLY